MIFNGKSKGINYLNLDIYSYRLMEFDEINDEMTTKMTYLTII